MIDDFDGVEMSLRRENRALAIQYIYMRDMNPAGRHEEALDDFFASRSKDRKEYAFAEEIIAGSRKNIDAIDKEIARCATNWSVERIGKVDLAILRVAIYELLFRDDIPPVVSINEAIELSKMFCGEESKRFVNGVLDNAREALKRPAREAVKAKKK